MRRGLLFLCLGLVAEARWPRYNQHGLNPEDMTSEWQNLDAATPSDSSEAEIPYNWRPDPNHALVPETAGHLARLYKFASTDEMEHWMLMTEDDIVAGRDMSDVNDLLDPRFVCDASKQFDARRGRHVRYGDFKIRGTNLGGQFVLEPWITPSMFYQFLGKEGPHEVAADMKGFCEALGPEEANKQLRRHWQHWVTEDDIRILAEMGIDTVRVPVGDWQFAPYPPYDTGCVDGANEELVRVLDLCLQYGIDVVMDMHALKGSQNGLDNSGESMSVEWLNSTHFHHWDTRNAAWIGEFDLVEARYKTFNFDHFQQALKAIKGMIELVRDHAAVVAIQPVNEPWPETPPNAYQLYVWTCYNMVQMANPNLGFFVHDSFRGGHLVFSEWMVGCNNIVSDIHLYTAWDGPWSGELNEEHFLASACNQAPMLQEGSMRLPHVVGEWSLATDNCAMWLNGFQDSPKGFPVVKCDYVPCPEPYMGSEQPGAPPDASLGEQLPRGSESSTPIYGMCPIDKSWEDDNLTMSRLARAKVAAFEQTGGWFFWNFKTELEPKWSFIESVRRGWMPDLNHLKNYGQTSRWIDGICDSYWEKVGFSEVPGDQQPAGHSRSSGQVAAVMLLLGVGLAAGLARGSAAAKAKAQYTRIG
ncbi:unnamed protein product [Chrysoparadoxa australica]